MINEIINVIRNTIVIIGAVVYYLISLEIKCEVNLTDSYLFFDSSGIVVFNYFVLGVFLFSVGEKLINYIVTLFQGDWDVSCTVFFLIELVVVGIMPIFALTFELPYEWYMGMIVYLIIGPIVSIPVSIASNIINPSDE